jgi:hypothetical protein
MHTSTATVNTLSTITILWTPLVAHTVVFVHFECIYSFNIDLHRHWAHAIYANFNVPVKIRVDVAPAGKLPLAHRTISDISRRQNPVPRIGQPTESVRNHQNP